MPNSLLKLSQAYASGQLTKEVYRLRRRMSIEQNLDFEDDLTKPDDKRPAVNPEKDEIVLAIKLEYSEQAVNNTLQVTTDTTFFCGVSKVFIGIMILGLFGLSTLFLGNRNFEFSLTENLIYRQKSLEQSLSVFIEYLNAKESFSHEKSDISTSLSQNDSFTTLNQIFDAAILDGAIDSFEQKKFLEYWDTLLPEEKEDWMSLVGLNHDQHSSGAHLENKIKGFRNLLNAIRKLEEQ